MNIIPMYLYDLENELRNSDDFKTIDDLHNKIKEVIEPYEVQTSSTGSIIIISDTMGLFYLTLTQEGPRIIQGYYNQGKVIYVECYKKNRLYLAQKKIEHTNQGLEMVISWFSLPIVFSRYSAAHPYEAQSDYLQKIADYCINTDIVTIPKLQRGLKIGFNRASNALEWLQNLGWIEPLNNSQFKVCVARKLRN
jgi:DNA segregation ATPase FtsK/SpoIIIE-like protein